MSTEISYPVGGCWGSQKYQLFTHGAIPRTYLERFLGGGGKTLVNGHLSFGWKGVLWRRTGRLHSSKTRVGAVIDLEALGKLSRRVEETTNPKHQDVAKDAS